MDMEVLGHPDNHHRQGRPSSLAKEHSSRRLSVFGKALA
jgi:hypothetical protein